MTSEFNPGQFIICGFEGATPEDDFLRLIENFPPAGFLLLEKNYNSPEQLRDLISGLRNSAGDNTLFSVDQEPGRVQRFKKGFPVSKKPIDYVNGELKEDFRKWCRETSSILRELGVNLNLAPILDLAPLSNTNPVLKDRVFGDDPDVISSYSRILIEEHKKSNVLTCGKHFPGLGSAKFDPHIKLSISDKPRERFENYHWLPFIKAAESGADFMMTTHLKAASIDPDNAATYSGKHVDMLRSHVGFGGPVISDDLLMGGAGQRDSIGSSAIKAIEAGHSLLIIAGDIQLQKTVMESIKNRYARDEMFAKIADDNEKNVRQIKDKIGY